MASEAAFSFRSDPGGLDALLHSESGPYAQWLTRLGNQVVNGAKARANVDTGTMRSLIEFRLEVEDGKLVGIVAARTNYSFYVHNGHGSYPGNPFLTDALREAVGGI